MIADVGHAAFALYDLDAGLAFSSQVQQAGNAIKLMWLMGGSPRYHVVPGETVQTR